MPGDSKQTHLARDIATSLHGALDWWRDAGVDYAFEDETQDWLAQAAQNRAATTGTNTPAASTTLAAATANAPPAQPEPVEGRHLIGGDPTQWPTTLANFQNWWLAEPTLDSGQVHARIPPRGPQAPALMVLVPHPEPDDADTLLSGPQGNLLTAMFAAMGQDAATTYIASALPRHTPLADWATLAASGLGAILRHHIALVAPRRLIIFGGNILPLLGNDPAQIAAALPKINQETAEQRQNVPQILPAADLAVMLKRPSAKARFWQDWLEWSESE